VPASQLASEEEVRNYLAPLALEALKYTTNKGIVIPFTGNLVISVTLPPSMNDWDYNLLNPPYPVPQPNPLLTDAEYNKIMALTFAGSGVKFIDVDSRPAYAAPGVITLGTLPRGLFEMETNKVIDDNNYSFRLRSYRWYSEFGDDVMAGLQVRWALWVQKVYKLAKVSHSIVCTNLGCKITKLLV
jgi:hypothetical protein